jgi:hypothetical protein
MLFDARPSSLIFGLGWGRLSPLMKSRTEYETVWSVLLPYIYESGIFGFLVVSWVFHYLIQIWRRAGRSAVMAVIFAVWVVGVTITTSYAQLLPLWMALGWFTLWPEICGPVPRRLPKIVRQRPKFRANPWSRRHFSKSRWRASDGEPTESSLQPARLQTRETPDTSKISSREE